MFGRMQRGFGDGLVLLAQPAQAQNYKVLHTFTGEQGDGASPFGGVTIDGAGNLYGTTYFGGSPACGSGPGCGNVFKLTHGSGGWTYSSLYNFTGGSDGGYPIAGVILDANGNLYGTTPFGGSPYHCSAYGNGCRVVFEIMP